MIKACIFDLDGTLAYTLDSMAVVGNEVVRKYGLKPMPIENYRYYCGNGADMLVKRLLVDAGDPELLHYEEARALYRKEFDKDPFYKIQHYPGMPETLKELKKRGVKLGVCSNKPHEAAVKVVERMFGSQIFDAVMGQSDSVRKKPAPDGPLKIAEQFGIKPEECMYLGDSGTDMQTGKAAGMYTVGVLWGYREKEELLKNGADYLVDAGDPELLHYEEARALYRKEFDKDPFYKIQHYPGMPETLKELKKRGVKLGVCSNKPHEAAVKVVERMFGSQIFDAVMGQSDSVRKKPAPDGPLKIAEQFGIKPEECMYLGDSGTDMQTGKAAGMYTVGVLWGYREKEELLKNGADYLVDSPEDILDLYEEKCEE